MVIKGKREKISRSFLFLFGPNSGPTFAMRRVRASENHWAVSKNHPFLVKRQRCTFLTLSPSLGGCDPRGSQPRPLNCRKWNGPSVQSCRRCCCFCCTNEGKSLKSRWKLAGAEQKDINCSPSCSRRRSNGTGSWRWTRDKGKCKWKWKFLLNFE